MTFADCILSFYQHLKIDRPLPRGIKVLNPYQDEKIFDLCKQFYKKYYNDNLKRRIILGINPGRFGAGLTGIPFVDPVKLETLCGIQNDLPKKTELSADFIHMAIDAYGGRKKFYSRFYINSTCPLGFTRDGKNLNYYDVPALAKSLEPFIVKAIHQQLEFNIDRQIAYCLGEGENFKYLKRLNEKEQFFGEIIPLAHPRFIMQYRRKQIPNYVLDYVEKLKTGW